MSEEKQQDATFKMLVQKFIKDQTPKEEALPKLQAAFPSMSLEDIEASWDSCEREIEESDPDPITLSQFLAEPIPKPKWIFPYLLPHPGITFLTGAPGGYKTFFSMWMAIRAAEGKHLFEDMSQTFFLQNAVTWETLKSPNILFIEEEGSRINIQDRFQGFKKDESLCGSRIFIKPFTTFSFSNDDKRKKLLRFIKKNDIKVLFVDPFSSVSGMEDENSNSQAADIMDKINREFISLGLSVVILHHPSKNGGDTSVRGAGDLLGKADVHITMRKEEDEETHERFITVSYEKTRVFNENLVSDFKIRLNGDSYANTLEFVYLGETKGKKFEAREKTRDQILETLATSTEEMTKTAIAESIGINRKNRIFEDAFKSLEDEKKIGQNVTTKKFYSLDRASKEIPPANPFE